MAEKILNTRIQLRYDTLENWTSSTLALKKGELAIVTLGTVKDGSTAGDVNQHPVLFKVGDGSHTFAQLPFASALAADVYAWAKASDVQLTNKELVFVGTNKKVAIPYITEDEAKGFINDALAAYSTTEQMNAAIKVEADRAKAAEEALGERIDSFNLPEGGFASKSEFDALKGKVEDEDGALVKANEAYALAETKANATETTNALAGKVDKTTTINGHALDSNVTLTLDDFAPADNPSVLSWGGDASVGGNFNAKNVIATESFQVVRGSETVAIDTLFDAAGSASTAEANAKAYTDAEIGKIPAQTDYTVTITETTTGLASDVAKKYTFTQNGAEIGSINLAKELVVTSGSVKEVTVTDMPYVGAVIGDKYIELVIANQDTPIYVPAKDLVDIYTAGANASEVQVAISNTNEITATLVNGGIAEEKLAEGVKTKLNKTWEEVGVAEGLVNAAKSELEGKINAKADASTLGDLAAKDTVAEADLDTALAEKINAAAAKAYTAAENGGLKVENNAFSIDDSVTFVFDCGDANGASLNA